ncbi:T9SS type A sorting domain-containing protein [Saccharicrinis sp. FJH54]|uniref:T9SS type A sorting domain-containing protein n=1 Tax=Saccharicrinis sp. FJH54 TaxID=3344665 RepID=UPI0035D3E416
MKAHITFVGLIISVMFLNAQNAKELSKAKTDPFKHSPKHTSFFQTQLKSTTQKAGTLDSIIYISDIYSPGENMAIGKDLMFYNQNGNLVLDSSVHWDFELEKMQADIKTKYEYDESMRLISKKEFEFSDPDYVLNSHMLYAYNENGKITEETELYNRDQDISDKDYRFVYSYDGHNYPVSKSNYKRNSGDETWVYDGIHIYTVDSNGRIIEDIIKDKDFNNDLVINTLDWKRTTYTLDENGQITKESVYSRDSTTDTWVENKKTEYTYENGLELLEQEYRLKDDSEFYLSWENRFTNDENGNHIKSVFIDLNEEQDTLSTEEMTYTYDLSAMFSDYATPYFVESVAARNKVKRMDYTETIDSEPVFSFSMLFHYSDDIVTDLIRPDEQVMTYIQNSNNIQFIFNGFGDNVLLDIYNISGKKILQQKVITNQKISLDKFPEGVYIYTLRCGQNIISGKFILQ